MILNPKVQERESEISDEEHSSPEPERELFGRVTTIFPKTTQSDCRPSQRPREKDLVKPQGPREKVPFAVTRQVGGEEPCTPETIVAARVSSSRDTLDRQSSSLRRPDQSPFHYKHHE